VTNAEILEYFRETFATIISLREAKSKDYGESEDALATIDRLSEMTDLTSEHAIFVLMCKHWDVLRKYAISQEPSVADPIASRIDDLIVYLVLMRAVIDERRRFEKNISAEPSEV
jgi:hypothetical protein